MATATTLITRALRKISSETPGEAISGSEISIALEELNSMLASWSGDNLMPPFKTKENFALISGQSSYTIGAAANFSTTRPDIITDAFIRDSSNNDLPIQIITQEQYNDIPLKTVQGLSYYLYYDPQYSNGIVYLYPTPDSVRTIFIESFKPFTAITSSTATIALPGQYEDAVVYNLAVRLALEYGYPISPDLKEFAANALSMIRAINFKPEVANFDPMIVRKNYWNIYSDGFSGWGGR